MNKKMNKLLDNLTDEQKSLFTKMIITKPSKRVTRAESQKDNNRKSRHTRYRVVSK